jgi:hypothetical protein
MQQLQQMASQMGFQQLGQGGSSSSNQPAGPPLALTADYPTAPVSQASAIEDLKKSVLDISRMVKPVPIGHQGLQSALMQRALDWDTSHKEMKSLESFDKKHRRKRKHKEDPSSESSSEGEVELMDGNRVQRMAEKNPGQLTILAMKEILKSLSHVSGEVVAPGLNPVFTKFYHLVLHQRLANQGAQREAQTLCRALDLLLTGGLANLSDLLVQRLKALEVSQLQGTWKAAKFLELLPSERPSTTSQTEQLLAARQAVEEQKILRMVQQTGKGGWQTGADFKGWKGGGKTKTSWVPRPPYWKGPKKGDGKDAEDSGGGKRGVSPRRPSGKK